MRVKEVAAWLTAPALLVVVASTQWYRVAADDQSTWSGVGFGMFATFESASYRRTVVLVTVDGEQVPAVLPEALLGRSDGLRYVPSEAATRELAEAVAARRWVVEGDVALQGDDGVRPDGVVVAVEGVDVHDGDPPTVELVDIRRTAVGTP